MSKYYLIANDNKDRDKFPKNLDIWKGSYTELTYEILGSCDSLIIYSSNVIYSPKFEAAIGVALGMNKFVYLINYISKLVEKTVECTSVINFDTIEEFIDYTIVNNNSDNEENTEDCFKNAAAILACAIFEKSYPDPKNKFINIVEFDLGKVKEFYKQYDIHFDDLNIDNEGICRLSYCLKSPPKLLLDKLKNKEIKR